MSVRSNLSHSPLNANLTAGSHDTIAISSASFNNDAPCSRLARNRPRQPLITDFFARKAPLRVPDYAQADSAVDVDLTVEGRHDVKSATHRVSVNLPPSNSDSPDVKANSCPINAAKHHRFCRIPTPRIITFNVRGLSAGASDTHGRENFRRTARAIKWLAKSCDILFLQEVGNSFDLNQLSLIPGFTAYQGSGCLNNRSVIYVCDSFAEGYILESFDVVEGFIHGLRFTPTSVNGKPSSLFSSSFEIINVYLQAGSSPLATATRLSQLEMLSRHTVKAKYILVGGDWNIVESPDSDTASRTHYAATPAALALLGKAFANLGVAEVSQPSFTRFAKGPPPQAARLDRIYISHSIADQTIMKANANVLSLPRSKGLHHVTDHRPVRLSFSPGMIDVGHQASFRVPEWVLEHPTFQTRFRRVWEGTLPLIAKHPVKRLLSFKRRLKREARTFLKESRHRVQGASALLTVAISMYRRALAGEDSKVISATLGFRAPEVDALLQDDVRSSGELNFSFPRLESYINGHFEERPNPNPPDDTDLMPSLHFRHKFNFLRHAKNTLPGSRGHLTMLVDADGHSVTSAQEIAQNLKEAWEPIWKRKRVSKRTIHKYLERYPKRLSSEVKEIDIGVVRAAIRSSGNTSAGPDGIPFLAYRIFSAEADTLFLALIEYLALSPSTRANRSFNHANLFFIPKRKKALRALNQRPISVSNTDNRIVSNCLRRVLLAPLSEIIDQAQAAFLPGRSIETPIRNMNDKYYSALRDGNELYVLLVDFAKAFDSVSLVYLFALLEHIGAPEWAINLLRSLYSDIRARPILYDGHNVIMNILDGLKQGCPLAPLLFVLVIDPLLYHLSLIRGMAPEAFADDLAVVFHDPRTLTAVTRELDRFTQASGIKANRDKTVLLTTVDEEAEKRALGILPAAWKDVRVSECERYLGTYLGTEVTVNSVFEGAWGKLKERVAKFLPYKSFFTLQGRIDIANSFLIPLFSFLFRFYMMTGSFMTIAERCISRWVIPNNRFSYEDVVACSGNYGLQRPLRDLFRLNIASQLRRRDDTTFTVPCDWRSRHMDDHRQIACCMYHHLCEVHPPVQASQTIIYRALSEHDGTPVANLTAKIARKRQWDRKNAEQLTDRVLCNIRKLKGELSPFLRHHLFEIVHNAVPTRHRMRFFGDPTLCRLCGKHPETMEHLLTQCKPVVQAKSLVLSMSLNKPTSILTSSYLDYCFQGDDCGPEQLLSLLMLSGSVWSTCRKFKHTQQPPAAKQVAWSVAKIYNHMRQRHFGTRAKVKRKNKRVATQLLKIAEFRNNHPLRLDVATDGSSFGNPGESGAGFVLREVGTGADSLNCHRSIYLGKGTNNRAELVAVDEALNQVLGVLGEVTTSAIIALMVDNLLALGVASGASSTRQYPRLGEAILRKVNIIRASHRLELVWVPGHAGLNINEEADLLAKRGASGITSWAPPNHQDGPRDELISSGASSPFSLESNISELLDFDHKHDTSPCPETGSESDAGSVSFESDSADENYLGLSPDSADTDWIPTPPPALAGSRSFEAGTPSQRGKTGPIGSSTSSRLASLPKSNAFSYGMPPFFVSPSGPSSSSYLNAPRRLTNASPTFDTGAKLVRTTSGVRSFSPGRGDIIIGKRRSEPDSDRELTETDVRLCEHGNESGELGTPGPRGLGVAERDESESEYMSPAPPARAPITRSVLATELGSESESTGEIGSDSDGKVRKQELDDRVTGCPGAAQIRRSARPPKTKRVLTDVDFSLVCLPKRRKVTAARKLHRTHTIPQFFKARGPDQKSSRRPNRKRERQPLVETSCLPFPAKRQNAQTLHTSRFPLISNIDNHDNNDND
jgi:ribonuclease HI/exonuclease III